jgi:hypothetical protein
MVGFLKFQHKCFESVQRSMYVRACVGLLHFCAATLTFYQLFVLRVAVDFLQMHRRPAISGGN